VSDFFDGGSGGVPVDVRAVLDSDVAGVLFDIVALGALVSFGTTSDGGALGVTVTVDGRWRRVYVRTTAELEDFVAEAFPAVRELLEAPPASSAPRKRQRRSRGL
jgi:hypothetical protein